MPCELAMVEASELATSATPAVLAKAAGGTLPKLIAADTALVPGAADADAGAAGSLGTLDGVPEGLAPHESVAVTEGVLEAAAVPVSEEDGEAPGARRVGVGAGVPVSEPDGEEADLGEEVGGVMVAEAVESVALGVDAGDMVTDAVAVESAPALVGDAGGETVAEAVESAEFEEPPLGDVAGETEGLAVASSVEVEFDAVVGEAVAVLDALTPAFGVAAGETVALAVAFDDVVGDVVAVAVTLVEAAAVDEGDAEAVALVELSAALGLAAGDRVGDAVAVAVALVVEFVAAALAGDNVGVAETDSVAETVGVADTVRVAETVGVAEASAPTPLSVMPALT